MINPWIILGLVLALGAAVGGSYVKGHSDGVDAQTVADQKEFDRINGDLAQQKTDAAAILKKRNADIIAVAVQRDQLKAKLGEQHANDQAATESARRELAGERLRFSTQNAGCGTGSGGTHAAGSGSTVPPATVIVELPETVARNLRQLAFDADTVRDNYALCYGYATQVK
jgi:hypothetical protein